MNKEKKIYLLMIIGAVFWAGAFIAGKFSVGELSPISLTFLRFSIASIIIFIIMVRYEKKNWRLDAKGWGIAFLLGLVGMVGYHVLFFTSLKYTTATNASMLAATNPLITAVIASLFANEKLGLKRAGVILLALVGVILTISKWNLDALTHLTFNKGDLIMLAAVLCWASYSVMVKKVMPRFTPLILTTYSFVTCTIILIPFVIKEGLINNIITLSYSGWLSVLYMALFPTVIGYLIQQIAIKEIGASRMALFINLVPVFSIVLAALILNEKITLLTLVSGAIIITAVYLNSRIKLKSN